MKPIDIPEIKEAENLLKRSENKLPSKNSIDDFKNAIEILDIYLEDYQDTPFVGYIHNIKVSYAKKIIEQLPFINSSNFSEWLNVIVSLFDTNEINNIIYNDASLKCKFDNFVDKWRGTSEFNRLVAFLKK